MKKIKNLLNRLFGIEEEKTREEDILLNLHRLVDKRKKVTREGRIEDHFTFLGEDYVAFSPDPKSNYLPIPSNYWRDIKNPVERILVELAYSSAYKN